MGEAGVMEEAGVMGDAGDGGSRMMEEASDTGGR